MRQSEQNEPERVFLSHYSSGRSLVFFNIRDYGCKTDKVILAKPTLQTAGKKLGKPITVTVQPPREIFTL